ncbi:MAG: peptide ABC transporter substrate-binding protein [Bdellovibrionales bacterium]
MAYDLTSENLDLVPALALSWESNENASEWTFKLRKDVKWSDGVAFTAQHAADGLFRLIDPKTAAKYAYFVYGIKNAKPFSTGELKDVSQVGINVIDDYTIKITLEKPMSFFPQLLTHVPTFPVRLDVIEKYGDTWTEAKNIVTLGPYKLKVWDHDKAIVLEQNKTYFGSPAKTPFILGYIINETTTARNMFDLGRLDAQMDLPANELGILRERKEFDEQPILGIFYFGFNTKKPPMDNLNVRKAISMAIDKNEIVKMLGGGQIPLNGWVPKGMMGYDENMGLKLNVEQANALLDQAGYKDRSKFPRITLSFNTNDNHKRLAENVQAQLKKNLGIQVDLKNEEWKVYLDSLRTDPPHIFRLGWLADIPDPDNFMNFLLSDSDNNHTNWGNQRFDKLVIEAASVTDQEKRLEMYEEAQRILVEKDIPVMPIYTMVENMMVHQRVKNFPTNAISQLKFKNLEITN